MPASGHAYDQMEILRGAFGLSDFSAILMVLYLATNDDSATLRKAMCSLQSGCGGQGRRGVTSTEASRLICGVSDTRQSPYGSAKRPARFSRTAIFSSFVTCSGFSRMAVSFSHYIQYTTMLYEKARESYRSAIRSPSTPGLPAPTCLASFNAIPRRPSKPPRGLLKGCRPFGSYSASAAMRYPKRLLNAHSLKGENNEKGGNDFDAPGIRPAEQHVVCAIPR